MPDLKPKSARLASALFVALLAAFLLLEASLRVWAYLQGPPAAGKILILGDAIIAGPDGYGAQLGKLLAGRGSHAEVTSAARAGANSAELLALLPSLLRDQRPRALVVMAGAANFWNRRYVNRYLDEKPNMFRFLSHWKVVRLIAGAFGADYPDPPAGRSVFFPDTPMAEYPTLALRWVGYLNAHPDSSQLPEEAVAEAEAAIPRWLKDPRSGANAVAVRVLANLALRRNQGEPAPKMKKPPLDPDPESPAVFGALAARLLRAGRPAEAESVFRQGLRQNPFLSGGELPLYQFYGFFGEQKFRALLTEALPSAASGDAEKPGLPLLRASFLSAEDIGAWAFHDLRAIVHLARDHDVTVLLQTYPFDRYSGREQAVDPVIRAVAGALEVPLSDTSSELSRRWNGRALKEFYGNGETLSREGSRMIAEILAEDLLRYHVVRSGP